eukprot:6633272-Prymnesium_polylepis.1
MYSPTDRKVSRRPRRLKSAPPMDWLWCARAPRKAVLELNSSATRLCGASGTRYMSLRGLIGSRPVPPT